MIAQPAMPPTYTDQAHALAGAYMVQQLQWSCEAGVLSLLRMTGKQSLLSCL